MSEPTYLIDLPPTYAHDRYERELDCGRVVKVGARFWRLEVTMDALEDIVSDADYQADHTDTNTFGLRMSARAARGRAAARLEGIKEGYRG